MKTIIITTILGHGHTLAATAVMGWILTAAIVLPAAWHAPAWNQAKINHTEAAFQTQQMWPQQFFGTKNKTPNNVMGNGGNFAGGNSGPV